MEDFLEWEFWVEGCNVIDHDCSRSTARPQGLRRFKCTFGVSPKTCAIIWRLLLDSLEGSSKYIHLLYALTFLRHYVPESVNRILFKGIDEKTFRTHAKRMVELLANDLSHVIDIEKRYEGASENDDVFVSLDATDCPINEPHTADGGIDPAYFSHKLNGAGVKYEIGLNIRTGQIVWAHGGVPCGRYSDLTLARSAFTEVLDDNEFAAADDGYPDENFQYPAAYPEKSGLLKAISQRHETVNNILKRWKVLSTPFRHRDLSFHISCFMAIANIVQITLESGDLTLFAVDIDDEGV